MFSGLRRFIERGCKGYCYEDLWEFNNWLSNLIANGLREFKQNCHTYPNDCDNWEEWMAILGEMIECFEEQSKNIENLPDKNLIETWNKRRAYKKEKLHRGLKLLEKYYYDLWD